jgi:hypothetical protein
LTRVPDYTTLYRCLRRLDASDFDQLLANTIQQMPSTTRSNAQPTAPPGTTVAVDATGLTPGAISTFFVNRVRDRGEGFSWRHWTNGPMDQMGGGRGSAPPTHSGADSFWRRLILAQTHSGADSFWRRLILAQMARPGPTNDEAFLPDLLEQAAHRSAIACVLADAECDRERTHRFIRQNLGAMSAIPAKRGKATWHLHGIRAQMRANFPHVLYRQRAGVETLFSQSKRKLSARAPGRSPLTQQQQALLLGVTFNLYRLRFPSFLCSSVSRMSTRPSHLINGLGAVT